MIDGAVVGLQVFLWFPFEHRCDRSTAKPIKWSYAEDSKNSPQVLERCVGVAGTSSELQ
ncbi:hypothetical protein LC613_07755 [Nostoc sphaeroides CHAB 2801]|uniref:hypothetical protein n=1 Tax=Nostoc sphaeroides TaxID=446679 RepID=UPI001E39C384|nr:hypothetical protein [Nostoc sphaeroides]MCC5628029.1 hypothetical protein [Nostoc sphaeroides CHAB 2801]